MILALLAGHAAEVEFCQKAPTVVGGAGSDFEEARTGLVCIKEDIDDHILGLTTCLTTQKRAAPKGGISH